MKTYLIKFDLYFPLLSINSIDLDPIYSCLKCRLWFIKLLYNCEISFPTSIKKIHVQNIANISSILFFVRQATFNNLPARFRHVDSLWVCNSFFFYDF